jgi:small subunit ribosomal protein S8
MVQTDPIADMLTVIRNGVRNGVRSVTVPSSSVKISVLQVLQREGFIDRFEMVEKPVQNDIKVFLKYGPQGESVVRSIRRISTPGRRVYSKVKDVHPVFTGMGIQVLSTPKGVLSDREAREANVGGEVICELW